MRSLVFAHKNSIFVHRKKRLLSSLQGQTECLAARLAARRINYHLIKYEAIGICFGRTLQKYALVCATCARSTRALEFRKCEWRRTRARAERLGRRVKTSFRLLSVKRSAVESTHHLPELILGRGLLRGILVQDLRENDDFTVSVALNQIQFAN